MAKSNLTQADAEMRGLMDRYWGWLREQTSVREVGDWTEITTPYLDRHNDHLQVYARPESDGWLLTDDGYVIDDLVQSGCKVESPKWKDMLRCAVAGYGVSLEGGALVARTVRTDFAIRKHHLVLAMLSVGGLCHTMESDGSSRTSRATQYTVVIEKVPRNFSAYVPDLPGCIATAATRKQAVREIQQAIEFHIEDLREQGESIPEPQSTATIVNVGAG